MQGYDNTYTNILTHARICLYIYGYTHTCKDIPIHIWISTLMQGYAHTYTDIPTHAMIYLYIYGHTHTCKNIPKHALGTGFSLW